MLRLFCILLLGLFVLLISAAADPITLTLDPPPGVVSGLPGGTVGWGYSIDNGSADYLLVSNSYFCAGAEDPLFTTCAPSLGNSTYQDFIASNGTEVAPGAIASQSFDSNTSSGVGEYIIDSSAMPGQTDIGSITIVYDLFDADPFGPNGANQIGGDMDLTAAAEVQVLGTSAVPEPGALTFPVIMLAALLASGKSRGARVPKAELSLIHPR